MGSSRPRDVPRTWLTGALASARPELVVFLVAVVCRTLVVVRAGGLRGNFGYDAAVYFAGSDALTLGRLPYRDFVFLHPPGQLLALTPWAALTRIWGDSASFTVANLSMTAVGASSAVLVMRISRRLQLGPRGAWTGGLFYATWFGAVGAEYLTKLEPVGNVLFLGGVLLALRAPQARRSWVWSAAGAALGLAVCVKIWWVVPVAVVIGLRCLSAQHPRRSLVLMTGGAAAAGLAVTVPFLVAAPGAMWTSVFAAQLGRRPQMNPVPRLGDLGTFTRLADHLPAAAVAAGTVAAGVVFLVVVVRAWAVRAGRAVVLTLAAQLAVLLAAPSWFPYYADYVAGTMAVAVAAAAAPRPGRRLAGALVDWLPTGLVAAVTTAVLVSGSVVVRPLPGATSLARSVAGVRCVMSDSPMAQIELDALSRGLAAGCPNWVDVTGRTYGPDRADVPRIRNVRWQQNLTRYLRSGDAVIVIRPGGTGISRATQAAIARDGVLARAGGQTVYRVRHG